jgi:hypothetical protein
MVEALAGQLERFRSGAAVPAPREDVVARFEYRRLAAALADVFDEVG